MDFSDQMQYRSPLLLGIFLFAQRPNSMETLLQSLRYECSSEDPFREIQRQIEIIDGETLRRHSVQGTNSKDPLQTVHRQRCRLFPCGLWKMGEEAHKMCVHVESWAARPNRNKTW
ncbi:putative BC2 protein [Sida chlorotic leaf virus]|uniref:BC2 protein n=1 Tax=Sida chlorotic leaf virus TaxID=2593923 RepID=A0A514TTT3_9GEMI|nr:putative BC2 protein [Sida chlorotic leaf virus]QDJ95895.1 putative BC2 protein [Sida chlorotic leaf virus]